MNYKPGVKTNMADDFSTNALVFATREEAQGSADELSWRWLSVVDTGVIETTDPVNYRFVNGKNVRIEG